jgi:hypothetical protein
MQPKNRRRTGCPPVITSGGRPGGERLGCREEPKAGLGPVSANHCARVLRALYNHAAELDRGLPVRLPTGAVNFNYEGASQKVLDFSDFPK